MRRFVVFRADMSATHDENQANPPEQPQFEGVEFRDGTVVIRWCTKATSTSVWDSFSTLMKVHGGHPGNNYGTRVQWLDEK